VVVEEELLDLIEAAAVAELVDIEPVIRSLFQLLQGLILSQLVVVVVLILQDHLLHLDQ